MQCWDNTQENVQYIKFTRKIECLFFRAVRLWRYPDKATKIIKADVTTQPAKIVVEEQQTPRGNFWICFI